MIMGLGQLFRSIDKSGDGVLSKDELADALKQFGISIPNEVSALILTPSSIY